VFLEDQSAHPVPVDLLFLKTFGVDYYEWEPETLLREIRTEFRATPSSGNMDCIQTVRALHTSNRWSKDWYVFEKIVIGLNNVQVLFQMGQQPTMGQLMSAVDSIGRIRPLDFGENVRRYCAAVIKDDGARPIPDVLSFCRDLVTDGPPNENGKDDEEYFRGRSSLMYDQLKIVEDWLSHDRQLPDRV